MLNKQEFVTIVRNISKRLELSATLPGAFNWSTALWKRLSPLRHWHELNFELLMKTLKKRKMKRNA